MGVQFDATSFHAVIVLVAHLLFSHRLRVELHSLVFDGRGTLADAAQDARFRRC